MLKGTLEGTLDRRDFLAIGTGCAAATLLPIPGATAAGVPKHPQPGAPSPGDFKLPAGGKMPTRKLGKTGVEVSMVGLGGYHLGLHDEATTARARAPHSAASISRPRKFAPGKRRARAYSAFARATKSRPLRSICC